MPHHLHPRPKMKTVLPKSIFAFFFLVGFAFFLQPQSLEANFVPGAFNSWTQNTPMSTSNMPANFQKYSVAASNDQGFKILRANNDWNSGWGSTYWITGYDQVWSLPYTGSGYTDLFVKSFAGGCMTIVTRTDNPTSGNSKFGFMRTSSAPITISSVSGGTSSVGASDQVSITITLSGSKCAEEKILVRYSTTSNFASSTLVTASGSGTSYTATIPTHSAGTTVYWYALTSTVSSLPATNSDLDFLTLSVMNNSGSNYSYQVLAAPTVTSPTVTSIAATSATLGGQVTAGTSITARGTVWGTSASPTGNSAAEGGTTTGVFTHSRTGLTANTLYYYRAYATNAGGTSYSADGTFTTLPAAPTVGTGSSATSSGFTANWSHPTMGSVSYTYTVEVDNDINFGSIDATVSSISSANTSQAITGLSPSTTYYYRVRAVNTTGSSTNSSTSAGISTIAGATLTRSASSITGFTATFGSAGTAQGVTINGTSLTGSPGNITITGSTNYEVSTTSSSSGFGATANLSYSSATLSSASNNVWIRLKSGIAGGTYNSETINISGGGGSTSVTVSGTVSTASQTITFSSLSNRTFGGASFSLSATASSGLTVAFASSNTSVATISGTTVTIVAAGSTTITASQAGNGNYSAATNVTQTLTVDKATPTISAAPTASGIKYAQQLSASNLSGGTASVGGTFAWTTSTTVADPGTNSYSITFTPTDTGNYTTATGTASVTSTMAQGRNANGAANPVQPGTIFVGDDFQFQFETWGTIDGAYGRYRLYLRQGNADLTGATPTDWTSFVNTDLKTFTPARFNASGTWYWGVQVDYGATYGNNFWLKAPSQGWTALSTTGTGSTLSFTVSALVNPGSQAATVNGSTAVDLGWTNGVSGGSAKFTSIFRSTSSTAPTLTQGSAYATNTDHSIGGQTYRCIYNGSGTSFTDTGLSAGQTYYYYFFAENYNHYSSGVSATASLTSEHVYNVASGSTTESNALGGSGNLTKSGNGELVLTGANNYTGNTTISAGTLRINADTRLGGVPSPARANSITIGSGTLALDGAITLNSNRGITLTSTSATLDDWGNNDTYNGIITNSGTAALTKVGVGILTLGGVNTFTGNTTISVGQIEITNASALGAGGSGNITSVASNAALRLSGGITVANELLTLNGTGVSDGGALRNVSGNNAWSSTITLAANARINSDSGTLTLGAISGGANVLYGIGAGDIAINGIISGDGNTQDGTVTSIYKDGAGTLTLTGANTFTGDARIVAGNLTVSGSGTLGSGSDIYIASGARLNVNNSLSIRTMRELAFSNGGEVAIGSGATLTISDDGEAQTRFFNNTSGSGHLNYSSSGNSTLSFYGNAAHSGNTTINSGRLTFNGTISASNLILNGGVIRLLVGATASSANITIGSNATLDVDEQDTAFTLGASKSLTISATGADTTATIRVAQAKDFTAYSRAITFSNFGSSNSTFPLTMGNTGTPPAGGQGAFLMNSTSTVTINTSTQLGAGTYKLIGKSSAWGVVTNDSLPTPVITGAGAVGAASLLLAGTDSRELFLVIAKGSSTISATGTTSFTYTGSPQGPDGHSKTGSGGAVTFSYVGTGGTSYGPSATKPTNAGTYSANATVAADSNYEAATSAALAFTIAKASSTISVTGSTSFTYSGSPQGPDGHSKTGSGGAVTFSYAGTGGTSYTGSATKPTNVGTYSATATVAADSNYETATSATYAFSITQATQAAVTGSLASSTITYNQTTTVTASGGTGTGAYEFQQNGGTGSVSFSGSGATRTLTPTAAGTAVIEVRRAGDSNYSASAWASAGTLTINLQVPAGLSVSMPSNTTNITLNWSDISGETSYDVQHSTSSTWAGATTITGITAGSTSRTVDVGAAGTYYIRVRGNATVTGNWSTTQVVQLRSLANGATVYLAPAGNVTTATVAGIFGASNAAGLAASSADNTATTIMLLNDAGATAHTLFYNNSASQWRGVGTSTTDRASESMPAGKAFMVKNNSGSTDYFLLNAEPRTAPLTVSVNANAGQMNLLTPAKSTATALNSLNLTAGGDNTTTGIKRATLARDADVIMIQNGSGRFIPYHFDGTNWRNNRTVISDPSTITVPAGGAFFIRKGPSSNFNSYTPPNE